MLPKGSVKEVLFCLGRELKGVVIAFLESLAFCLQAATVRISNALRANIAIRGGTHLH